MQQSTGHEIQHHATLSIDGIAAMAVAIIYSSGECGLEVTAQVSDNIGEFNALSPTKH
jgi:hypothetical protein